MRKKILNIMLIGLFVISCPIFADNTYILDKNFDGEQVFVTFYKKPLEIQDDDGFHAIAEMGSFKNPDYIAQIFSAAECLTLKQKTPDQLINDLFKEIRDLLPKNTEILEKKETCNFLGYPAITVKGKIKIHIQGKNFTADLTKFLLVFANQRTYVFMVTKLDFATYKDKTSLDYEFEKFINTVSITQQ